MSNRRYTGWRKGAVLAAACALAGFLAARLPYLHARPARPAAGTWERVDAWEEARGTGGRAVRLAMVKERQSATGDVRTRRLAPAAGAGAADGTAPPRDRLHPRLRERYDALRAAGRADEPLDVIVWLKLPPAEREGLQALLLEQGEEFEPPARLAADRSAPARRAAGVRRAEAVSVARRARIAAAMGRAIDGFLAAAALPADRVVRRFALGPGLVVRLTAAECERFGRQEGVNYLFPDETAAKELDLAVPATKGPTAWAMGYDGSGVTVAHIEPEPGRMETDNPYLAATVFRPSGGVDSHATEIGGLIASTHSEYRGLAPGCTLLNANAESTNEAALDAAADWALTNGASVVNLSFGLSTSADGALHWSDIYFDYLVHYGRALFTKSAGNEGEGTGVVTSPGRGYNSLAVGNVNGMGDAPWLNDAMRASSSYVNPVTGTEKPEIAAYGTDIYTTSTSTPWVDGPYVGTSYAAPLVAAIAALCIDRTPSLADEPEALKAKIMASGLAHNIEGDGRLSGRDGAGKAVATAVNAGSYAVTLTEASFDGSGYFEVPVSIPLVSNDTERIVLAWSYPPAAEDATPDASSYLKADLDLHVFVGGTEVASSVFGVQNPFEVVDYAPAASTTATVRIRKAAWTNGLTALRVGLAYVAQSALGTGADPVGAPEGPGGVAAYDGTAYGDARVTWDPVSGAEGYVIWYTDDEMATTYTPIHDGLPASGENIGQVTGVTVRGLAPGTVYYFAVGSSNVYGEGPLSTEVTATSGSNLVDRFARTGTPELDGAATNAATLAGGAALDGSFPYEAYNAVSNAAVVAVVGMVDPSGASVGGVPQAVYAGTPPRTGTTGVASWTALQVPTTAGVAYLRYRAYWTDSEAAAVAAFLAAPPTNDTGSAEGLVATVTTTYDADADGLPDWWERVYSGTPTGLVATVDNDGDGPDNTAEWWALTDPTNGASFLRLTFVTADDAGRPVLRWPAASNRVYGVWRGTNLGGAAPFSAVASNLAATLPENVFTDTVNGTEEAGAYYRIGVREP